MRADAATEVVDGTLWIAPFPHGPVVRLEGTAIVLLDQFRNPTTVADAANASLEVIAEAPADARTQLISLADSFVSSGLLTPAHNPLPLEPSLD